MRRLLYAFVLCIVLPRLGGAETLTNKEGKTIEVEIIGFVPDGIKVKKGGKEFEVKADTLDVASMVKVKALVEAKIKAIEAEQAARKEALAKLGPHGWNDSRWGMTADQIRDAYPKGERPEKQDGYVDSDGTVLKNGWTIPEYEIGKIVFQVKFLLHQTKGLCMVVVTRTAPDAGQFQFDHIAELLTRKYGGPNVQKKSGQYYQPCFKWFTEGMDITLAGGDLGKAYLLNLAYTRPNKEALKKL